MVHTYKYLLVEERLGQPLADRIQNWRAAGVSCPAIARLLQQETRVELTGQTVRTWLRKMSTAA